ncbi:hypothetical protein EHF33_03190 [Deinococcus psychrotolerans]|uniref:Lipoprotein n=1 Tax=Deinococcus psychrotolerans TaxID=2489213 RepID=A0A3G8Y938_9DEIO|nr:hypothetical protein [Deinococcus psychrotolerans]AZI41878.1 hypothetical protein EHF33_03190 [Deinococcus psychrotolerans]
MKKNLMLLALAGIFSLAACSPPSVPAAQVQQLTDLAPVIVKAAEPAPLTPPLFPAQPPVTFGGPEQSWLEVTTYQAEQPLTGDSCTATASRLDTGQVSVISVGCAGVSFATVHVIEASGRDTPQLVGPQNLVITQRAQGVKIAEPTFRVLIEGKQIWPK